MYNIYECIKTYIVVEHLLRAIAPSKRQESQPWPSGSVLCDFVLSRLHSFSFVPISFCSLGDISDANYVFWEAKKTRMLTRHYCTPDPSLLCRGHGACLKVWASGEFPG